MGELIATGFTRLSVISLYGILLGRICQPMICSCKLLIETNIILLWKASEESCLHRVAIIHSKNKTRLHFTRATYQKTLATFTLEEIFSGWNDMLQWSAMFPDLFRHFFTLFGSGGIYIYTKIVFGFNRLDKSIKPGTSSDDGNGGARFLLQIGFLIPTRKRTTNFLFFVFVTAFQTWVRSPKIWLQRNSLTFAILSELD